MPDDLSITQEIERLRSFDPVAAQRLWQVFFERVVGVAARRLSAGKGRVADEEDVALSVFNTVFKRVQKGEFPNLNDRNDLWKLLVTITERKAANVVRDEHRLKRGGGKLVDLLAGVSTDESHAQGIDQLLATEITPEFVACAKESLHEMLAPLDDEAKQIAIMRFEGYTNEEIAVRLNRSIPTIERRLRIIRTRWSVMNT